MQPNPIDSFVQKIATVKDDLDEILLDGISALSTAQFEVEEWKATAQVRRVKMKKLIFELEEVLELDWNDPTLQLRVLKIVLADAKADRG